MILWFFCRIYTEELPGDAAEMLFIKNLREEDSGMYRCEGIYANNEQMVATVQISTFSKLLINERKTKKIYKNPAWIEKLQKIKTYNVELKDFHVRMFMQSFLCASCGSVWTLLVFF